MDVVVDDDVVEMNDESMMKQNGNSDVNNTPLPPLAPPPPRVRTLLENLPRVSPVRATCRYCEQVVRGPVYLHERRACRVANIYRWYSNYERIGRLDQVPASEDPKCRFCRFCQESYKDFRARSQHERGFCKVRRRWAYFRRLIREGKNTDEALDLDKAPPVEERKETTASGKRKGRNVRVVLDSEQCGTRMKVFNNGLGALCESGYRMVRASQGVSEGHWFFEVTVENTRGCSHSRIGWSTNKGNLEAPVGFDRYSYGYRDVGGTKFHQRIGQSYAQPYTTNDIIGCYLYLPAVQKDSGEEIVAHVLNLPENSRVLPGSFIRFTRNGVDQGVAFTDLFRGCYYPAVSLYMGGQVKFNFGPNFAYPPPTIEVPPSSKATTTKADDAQDALVNTNNSNGGDTEDHANIKSPSPELLLTPSPLPNGMNKPTLSPEAVTKTIQALPLSLWASKRRKI